MPGVGGMPGPQREVPEAWPRQVDPPGHLEAALREVVRAEARAWLGGSWRPPLEAVNQLGPPYMAAGTQDASDSWIQAVLLGGQGACHSSAQDGPDRLDLV